MTQDSQDYATKQDLKDHSKDIKEHITLLIAPIIEKQNSMEITLTGPSKLNGLVGRVKVIGTHFKYIYALLVIAIGFLIRLFMSR